MLAMPSRTLNQATSGSGAPGPESVPRGSKSTTFAKGIFSRSNFELPAEISFESSAEIPPESPAEISFELPSELSSIHLETHFEV